MQYGFNYGFSTRIAIGGGTSIPSYVWVDSNIEIWVDEHGNRWEEH